MFIGVTFSIERLTLEKYKISNFYLLFFADSKMKYYQFLIPTLLGLKNQKKVPSESMGVDDELNVLIQNEQHKEQQSLENL